MFFNSLAILFIVTWVLTSLWVHHYNKHSLIAVARTYVLHDFLAAASVLWLLFG
jgi:hypothetical protein